MTDTTFEGQKPFSRPKTWEIYYKISWQAVEEMQFQNPSLMLIRLGKLRDRVENEFNVCRLIRQDIGILTAELPHASIAVELLQRITETLGEFHRQKFFSYLLENITKAAYEKNLKELELLKKLCETLEKSPWEELPLMNYFLRNQKEILRFATYIAKEKKHGLTLAQKIARLIKKPVLHNFRNREILCENFLANRNIGYAWYKRWQPIKTESEYLMIIKQIINHSDTKKVMWNAPALFKRKPRLAYVYRKNQQKPIIVTIDEYGFIEKAGILKPIWQDILKKGYMNNFYKVNDFPEEFLMPA